MNKTLTRDVVVLGTGSIGSRHLSVLKQIRGTAAVAIPRRSERRKELEKEGFNTAQNLAEAARQGIRLCIVATDTSRHVEDSVAAMNCGMDVLVEKPLSVNAKESLQILQEAKRLGRRVFVGCCLRFSESLNAFCDRLKDIGRIRSVRIVCQSYLPDWRPGRDYRQSYSARADEGGVLRDLIHEIDYAGWLFGWPASLQAILRNTGQLGIQAEESADLLWETSDGGILSMRLDYLSRIPTRGISVAGEKGNLTWNALEGMNRDAMMTAQTLAFLQSADGALNSRLATVQEGIQALAVCDAARNASERGAKVEVLYRG